MYRFKIIAVHDDGRYRRHQDKSEMTFFVEVSAGNERAAREMIEWFIKGNVEIYSIERERIA